MTPGMGVRIGALCLVAVGCRSPGLKVERLDAPSAGASMQSADPALAVVSGSAEVVISWIEGDGDSWALYAARSTDRGGRWSSPVQVAGGAGSPGEVRPHGESSPRLVAASRNRLALVWPNSVEVPGRKWPATKVRFARSEDAGVTWTAPMTLNDDTAATPVSHQFHGAASVGEAGLTVAWLDERQAGAPRAAGTDGPAEHPSEPDATIYYTTSPDFGRSWTPNRVGWRQACPCCRVTLATNLRGQVVAAWRKHYPGNVRDVVTSIVGDDRAEPERVHQDDWSYPGCPHTGPALAVGPDGASHIVWYNGKPGTAGIYYSKVTATGRRAVGLVTGPRVGTAHAAVAALGDGGALAAYDISERGERTISVARLDAAGEVGSHIELPGSNGGKYPQLAVLDASTALVAWTSSVGDRSLVRLARLTLR